MKRIIFSLSIAFSLSLQSCVPAAVTAVTATGVVTAQDRTFGEVVDDTTIWTKIESEFIKRGFKELFSKIDVSVMEGRVLLTGYVANEEDMLTAVEICWTQKGVREVVNELKVDPNSAKIQFTEYVKDSWITNQVKSKLFFNKEVKYVNYTVVTQKNIVYLFGLARTREELETVANIAASISGVEEVISHVRVINSKTRLKSVSEPKY